MLADSGTDSPPALSAGALLLPRDERRSPVVVVAAPRRAVGREPARRVPHGLLQRRQERLRRPVRGAEEARLVDLAQPAPVEFQLHAVVGQRLGLVRHRQRLAADPPGSALPGQFSLRVQPPATESKSTGGIEPAQRPQADEPDRGRRDRARRPAPGRVPRPALPIKRPRSVREMRLAVVVGEKARVRRLQLRPAPRPGVVVVGHPARDADVGRDGVLPRLGSVDLGALDTGRRVDEPSPLGLEDGPTVADEGFGRAPPQPRPAHDQVGGKVLARREHARQQIPAVILPDRNRVRRLVSPQRMAFEVTDIDRLLKLGLDEFPVALGDDFDDAVGHFYGGLIVNCVRRDRDPGRPLFYVGQGRVRHVIVIKVRIEREIHQS